MIQVPDNVAAELGASFEAYLRGIADGMSGRLAKYSYGTTQVDIDPASDVGMLMELLRDSIDSDDLTGNGLETEPHVTVRYGILGGEDLDRLREYVAGLPPFMMTFGVVDSFPATEYSDGAAVIKVNVESDWLMAINRTISLYAGFKPANFGYHPHSTIAYVRDDTAEKYTGSRMLAGKNLWVTAITVCGLHEAPEVIKLTGTPGAADSVTLMAAHYETLLRKMAPPPAHKAEEQPEWIGVDLDGTLAFWTGDHTVIGKPTDLLEQVKSWLAAGEDVRIFTARVAEDPYGIQRAMIEAWCIEYIGQKLPVTCVKDRWCKRIYDDRAVQVEYNTGAIKLAKYSPDQERVPAGSPDGGEFGSGGGAGSTAYSTPNIDRHPTDFLVKMDLEKCPAQHMDGLKSIGFHSDTLIQSSSAAHGGKIIEAFGVYIPSQQEIVISANAKSATGSNFGQNFNVHVFGGKTVIHEVGHHVHLAKLTDEAAKQWSELSDKGQNARISAYARSNTGEHFAEAYRAYQSGGGSRAALKNLEPRAYKFMVSIQKNGNSKMLGAGQMAGGNWEDRYRN